MKRQIGTATVLALVAVSFSLPPANAGIRTAVEKARGEYHTFDTSDARRPGLQPRTVQQAPSADWSAQDGRRYSYQPSAPAAGAKTQGQPASQRDAVSKARGGN